MMPAIVVESMKKQVITGSQDNTDEEACVTNQIFLLWEIQGLNWIHVWCKSKNFSAEELKGW